MIAVAPIALTNFSFVAAEHALGDGVSFRRRADQLGLDLTTPSGQFRLLSDFTPIPVLACLVRVGVVATMTVPQLDAIIPTLPTEIGAVQLRRWQERKMIDACAVYYDATLRDWYRLHKSVPKRYEELRQLVDGVKAGVMPTKIWTILDQCNNAF